MDAITDPTFHQTARPQVVEETPSLLTVVIDTAPKLWTQFDKEDPDDNTNKEPQLLRVIRAIVVFLNSHLAFNTNNQVAVIAAHSQGIKYLYPKEDNNNVSESTKEKSNLSIINKDMYRQFRNVDESLVDELFSLFQEESKFIDKKSQKSTISGAMSCALTYVNRITKQFNDASIFKSRLLVITCGSGRSKDEVFQYIPIMNCIFSATKMKCPIDVVKIGGHEKSTFLQQTTDATNGVYLYVENTKGLIQYLSTAMFIDSSLRSIIVKPNHGVVDFRTSCFLTGRVVAVGYICSVCLCVLSIVPKNNKCPACDSKFDEKVIARLNRGPVLPGMTKRVRKNK
ncbi:hypothetical protein TBLA_0B02470 [Henningerozyma blattae CBS 6284]|uniref:General transcription and DNA repair factor IIH subunit TFB4 n=1 Tax=Henningerozyma blattae (strain ATCC 34711 / CBS 6284 / DSM 70876 / NBRC 10599 / NRRL Y-10934 / UCD 77-7) TaxID=1071380 RepID=I2GY87_HENB6|nr:hypothetical protein TBLA_0B02470 [Tetrapisispora blattae CBS 6284]CCH59089.1 hypothetical protein TBLA_0B02470 [Tetrapisispora blattae CBS 6284]